MTEPTCPGRCCAVFTLSEQAQLALIDPKRRVKDERMVVAMVKPLSWWRATLRYWRLGYGWHPRARWRSRGLNFTCRFWDTHTRRCRRYANRPDMCRRYGTDWGDPCEHGCGAGCSTKR